MPRSPGDTDGLGGAVAAASLEETNIALREEASKSGTNLDSLVGRLVIDQGLATADEVKHCLALVRGAEDASGKTLSQLLVEQEYVTERQLIRLKERIEAERKGKIPGYSAFTELGAGAMAKVYRAKQNSLDRLVAIKVLPKKYATNPQFIERFFNEGRAAAALNHPNIVQAFDVNNVGDLYYFVMEYVDGRTVHDDIQTKKRYAEADAINIVLQVAEALDHAHGKGLIHRDVKPKNVMITKQGVVKLADMGLARAISDKEAAEAEAGKAFGTPYYISPEQIRGERDIGPQTDIYSLGATLYHMVTGQVPFDGKNPSAVMHKHLKAPLVPPDHVNAKLSPGIAEVIEMMMAKDANARYRSCKDLILDLRDVQAGKQPRLAHKDVLPESDVGSLLQAEAAAASEIPVDRMSARPRSSADVVRSPLFVVMAILMAASVIFNVVLLVQQ